MPDTEFLTTDQSRTLAFRRVVGRVPSVVFLGGLRSDLTGVEAVHLESWAERSGQDFLSFDYSGHGASSGAFTEGCIGDWVEDAVAVITSLTNGPVILVGHSMGGWIALLIARIAEVRVRGLVTIAAAPDFTEDDLWAKWSAAQRKTVMEDGEIALPSRYGAPLVITRRMIEDGRDHLVLRDALELSFPVRMLQGSADRDVPMSLALRLFEGMTGDDIHLVLLKGADHRFSDPVSLRAVTRAIEDLLERA